MEPLIDSSVNALSERDMKKYYLAPNEEIFLVVDEGNYEDSLRRGYELRDLLSSSGPVDASAKERYQYFCWRSRYEHVWPEREKGRVRQNTNRVVMIGQLFEGLLP